MAHVGQELALVLAGLRQQPRLVGERALHPQQLLGLHLQADVGLLELGLLHFHAGLRFLQDAALLFQLFVADAQLFLLGPVSYTHLDVYKRQGQGGGGQQR